jgi:hypothetical protein
MDTTPVAKPAFAGLSPDAFSSLFRAIGGLRNQRALTAMFSCFATGVLLSGLIGLASGSLGFVGSALGVLIAFVAIWTGVNAAGVLLMDQAKGVPSRGLVDALVFGLMCIPKVVVLALAFFAVAIAVFIVLALVFAVCKIPLLGPLLYVVVFPLSVVVAGVTMWGLFICMFLSLPAIWEGAAIMSAIAQSLTIVRSRLIETLLLMAFVWFLSFVVGLIVFGVLAMGMVPAASMSASIIGGGFGGMMGAMQGMGMGMGGGGVGHAIAAGIGTGVLFAIASTLVSQVYLLGLNLVYLRVTEGLDASATRAALQQKIDEARRRAADVGQTAREAAERARTAAAPTPAPAASPVVNAPAPMPRTAAPAALTCPKCHAAVAAEDVFCEACGHRLK